MLDFTFTDAQEQLRERVRAFAAEQVAPGYLERARSDDYPAELHAALAAEGLLGLRYPAEIGGGGLDEVSLGIVLEELAKADMNAALFAFFLMGTRDGERAPAGIRDRLAKEIIQGETVTAAGITEPQGGSDVASIRTTATRDGDEYVINGEKVSVGMAAWARYATVLCRVGGEGYRGLGSVFLDLDAPGVERGRIRDMGSGIVGRGWLRFTDVRVPAEHLLLPAGEGFVSTMKGFDVARVLVSMMTLGTAIASLDDAVAYARERVVFGRPIAHYQGVAFRLAEDATLIDAMRLLVYRALWMADRGVPHTKESSMCKWWVPLTSQQICHRSLLTFGHYGYNDENPVQQRYRDVVGLEIGDGTAEIQKLVVARRLLGREAGSV
jgi:cyclohexanecarboxyl-CoA dehydrogenase